MTPDELTAALLGFTGSTTLTRHGLTRHIFMTAGVVFLADAASAHWLTDLLVAWQADPKLRSQPFQVWTLRTDPATRRATVTMTNGNSGHPIAQQEIDWTDFPLPEITLWLVQEGSRWIMLLPQEY